MAYEMIGEKHPDRMINGQRTVYVAAEAEAVRVTVRRDGLTKSAEVEILGPDTDGWSSVVLEAMRLDGSAESGRIGAVLTFPSGERVTIGERPMVANEREEIRSVRDILSYPGEDGIGHTVESMARHVMDRWKRAEERALAAEKRAWDAEGALEALRASARCADAPPPARWWQTVGAWGTREGRDTSEVVLVGLDGAGAWMRYPNGVQQWMSAAMLDDMTPIAAPPAPPVDEDPIIADSAFEMLAEWWGILEAAVEGEVIPTHRGITTREAVEFLYAPARRVDPKWNRFRESFESLDGGGHGIPDPRRIGAALRRYRGRTAANGYRIAMKMDHGACRWTADMGAAP